MEENTAQNQIIEIPVVQDKPWLKFALFSVLGMVLVGGLVFAAVKIVIPTKPQERACTTEAKICPDGSAVGRTGPNCEFAPCPTQTTQDETANWKTYKNTDYKYSFRYAPDISISEGNNLETNLLPGDAPVYQVILTKNGQEFLTIETTKNYSPNSSSIYLGTPPRGERTIAGISWGEFFIPNEYGEGPYIPPVYVLTKEYEGVLYGIRTRRTNTDNEQDQVLSTFRFLE